MKKLGFGCMRLPLKDKNDPSSIDIKKTTEMFDLFLSEGFTYFDTAYFYHKSKSEEAIRDILVKRYPRESFSITDKLPIDFLHDSSDVERIYSEQIKRLDTEYFDYYFMHAISRERFDIAKKLGVLEFLDKKKSEGEIKHIGFSFHGKPEELEYILDNYTPELVQIQLNYYDWYDSGVESEKLYKIVRSHGTELSIMEPLRGGALADPPQEVKDALDRICPGCSPAMTGLRFAASHEGIKVVLSGMSTIEQVRENISFMKDFKPLPKDKLDAIADLHDVIDSCTKIKCTACNYCTEGCPMNIPIPEYFELYNKSEIFGMRMAFTGKYKKLSETRGKASDCLSCGACEQVCTQGLPISSLMAEVSKKFDK